MSFFLLSISIQTRKEKEKIKIFLLLCLRGIGSLFQVIQIKV